MELTEKICKELFALKCESAYGKFEMINTSHRKEIEETIKKTIVKYENEQLAKTTELEAKIKVYEEIISKSNFAPFVEKKTKKKEVE